MAWVLLTNLTVEDTETGFVINLLSGSWSKPDHLETKAPNGMAFREQAKCLRLGIEFATDLVTK
jgi:hypothetical protein